MRDSFDGINTITLQPGDTSVPYLFRFKACSAATANDGSLPYGSTVKAIAKVRTVHLQNGTSSTGLITSKALSSNKVTLKMQYSTALPKGQHKLSIRLNIALSGSTFRKEYDFTRLYLKDR